MASLPHLLHKEQWELKKLLVMFVFGLFCRAYHIVMMHVIHGKHTSRPTELLLQYIVRFIAETKTGTW